MKFWKSSLLNLFLFAALLSTLAPALVAQTGNVVILSNTTWATGTYSLTSLSVENGATLTIGGGSTVTVSGAILVTANSNVVLQSINNAAQVNSAWKGAGVTVSAGTVQVDSGSSINADGQGYLANAGPGGAPGGTSAGGSYGGLGGVGNNGSPTGIYGSNTAPTDLGSGGSTRCCNTVAGLGGGAIRLIVSGTLTDNGVISANGGPVTGLQAGAGAGGSIYVTAAGLVGSGTFTANGGTGGEAAGGGGRIAVYYNAPSSNFTGFSTSTSTGGSCGSQCSNGTSSAGGTGTAGFFDTSTSNPNLMVDQDLMIPAGTTVTYNSIQVQPGAILTIGGGSTITVTNALTVGGSLVAQSMNNTAQVNGSWQGSGVILHAASVLVNSGGSIVADGQGYIGGAGPGGAPVGTSAGGSYGGLGGVGDGSSPAGTYGSTTAPTDLGSGGNTRCCSTIPGSGGGALTITVSGSLTDNGIISANGGDGVGTQVGGGSGGTVSIQTGTLTGSGSVAANGGAGGEAGGGGGRVALYYNTNNGFNTTMVTSNGGTSSGGNPGASGTVYTLGAGSNLTVSDNTTLPANANLNFNSVTVNNGATLTVGSGTTLTSPTVTVTAASDFTVGGGSTLNVSGAFVVTGNSNVVLQSINTAAQINGGWQGTGVTLNAGTVQVDAGSSINADGQGYLANAGPGGAPGGTSAGGSYGGLGGVGENTSPAAIYGSNTTPTDLGSGGSTRCCSTVGGLGGGAIRLIVSGTLTDNGVISANGGAVTGLQAGAGAGGSVWVTTAGLAGSGLFAANGGTGGEAAGGGGRIAVYYNAPTSTFTGFATSTSSGGSCGSQCSNGASSTGGTGTAGFFDTSSTNDNLMVDQDLTIPAGTTVSYNSISVLPNATLTIGGGSKVTVAGSLTVSGTLVAQAINNTMLVNGTWQGSGVSINATSILVNQGGSINADAQGYVGSAGPGGASAGTSAGGSYGGLGGVGNGSPSVGVYGSTTSPTDLGSGGGTRCCSTIPGAGGGALSLTVTETLTDNGIISANGGDGTGLQVGGGSGGTVAIQTGTLTGSGTITSAGGAGGEAGGGGGRIALYYNTNNGFDLTLVKSSGGASSTGNPGAPGTVYTLAAGTNLTVSFNTVLPTNANLTYTSVVINNQGTLTLGSGTTITAGNLSVAGAGTFTVGGGSTVNVSGAFPITGNSNVVLQSINTGSLVSGTWQGKGVTVNAGSIQVDAGSSINADSQGYLANAGPGGAPGSTSAGGSYGGLGGVGNNSPPAAIYGSNTTPTDLGSGGSSRCCNTVGGLGGGAVRLIVSGTLTDNGVISANGGGVTGLQAGAGSGGSVWVTTTSLAGSGSFAANGGTGGEAAGGGGRIAVYYNGPTSTFTGFTASTSNGGGCGSQCSNGTTSAGGTGTAGFFDTSSANDNLMVDQDLTIPAGTTVSYNSITVQPNATLTIGGGSTVTVAGTLTVSGTVIAQAINNTALIDGSWQGSGVTLNAATLVVNSNGSISADGQGYVPNAGPGGALPGTSAGGSYGGVGGSGNSSAASATYGSATLPVDLGSGGSSRCCSAVAGAGGGALFFNVSGTFTNDGIISANGAPIVGYQAGGGSGGTVYVKTSGLTGSGSFTANGGLGGEAGGSGGRVAIYYDATASNFSGFSASTASGAGCGTQCTSATASPGSNGTAAFFDTSVTYGNIAIYQNFTIPAGASPTYNSVTVQPGALMTIGGGATLSVTDALTVSGTVIAQSANNTTQVNDVWAGSGVAISAGSINVKSTGSLNADLQGYVAGAGPGGAPAGTSAGGSYGGLGGTGSGSAPASTYGSEMLPVDLGSGGGTRCCGTVPGVGGGDLLLTASGTLTDDGVISANGGDGTGLQVGGGSGGSVSIHAPMLTGAGTIAANGGSGGEAGGGGGRVALYFNTATGFNLAMATATGGSSDGSAGAVGTVYIPGVLVIKSASTTALNASATQVALGQAVIFQATVTALSGPTPTGMVNFIDGTTVIGTQSLIASAQSGTATVQYQTTALAGGAHSITAVYSGDANVLTSTSPAQTVTVSPAATTATLGLSAATIAVGQTETLTLTIAGGIANPAVAGTVSFFDTTANAGLGTLAVTPTSTGGTATLAVTNLTVGTHVLNAVYSGNSNYLASTTLNQTVVVTAKTQTITFAAIPDHVFGDAPFTLAATASSNLPVSYAVTNGPATVAGNVVTITGAGAVAIQATQAGNATTYAAASPVTRSFTVAQATQTITFPGIPNHAAGDAPFQLSATASSGLAVSYAITAGPATIAGNLVTLTGAGTVQIQATQVGNTNFVAATPVNQSFTVSLQSQTISFPAIPNHTLGDAPFALSATASSGLTVSYSVTSGPATVSTNTVTLTGAGAVVIQAVQTGNAIYAAAASVTQSFTVSSSTPTLASIAPAGGVVGSGATTIALTGTNFASTDTVQLNGAAIVTTFVSSTTLTAVVPASFLTATATGQITVFDSVTKSTTVAQSFSVLALPDVNFSGPPTAASASQPSLTFQLVNPYPFPIAGALSLAFAPSGTDGADDPAVQFAAGGRTLLYTIPALSQVTPTVQIQSGTVAGVATVTLVVTSNGVNVTPANVTPVEITIPPIVPMITTAAVTRSGTTLTLVVHGFSNTRELSTAKFHFTAAAGSTVATPDITLPVTAVFGDYFTSPAAVPYGSTFLYTQTFNLNNDASSIQNVMVTLVNSVGDSIQMTAQ